VSDRLRTLLAMLKTARDLVHEFELMAAEETEAPAAVEDGADPVEEPVSGPVENFGATPSPAAAVIIDRQLERARRAVARVNGGMQ